jgi:ribonucleotide monophosphatase NagD (HAD superfamily)
VVYAGGNAIAHAVDSLAIARAGGMRLAYVTNNALRTPDAVAEHLTELGIPTGADDVITSAQAVARLISEQVPAGSRVLVIGGEGLRVALRERGLEPVDSAEDQPVAVVQGYGGPDLAWGRFAEACYAIARGVPWFASNTDLTIPSARGIAPGNGAAVEVVRIAFNGDVDSLLVLTGVTDGAQLLAAPPQHRPTYVDADLRGMLTGQPEVTEAEEGFRCGGWTATASRDRLELDGDGEPLDGLRALCAAAWTAAGEGSCTLDGGKALARLGL